ncbi:MAG: aminodeoxychorismate synthase component I [Chthoniobacteraceae bacterium]
MLSSEFSFEKPAHLLDLRSVPTILHPAAPRPVALDLTPVEAAARLRHLPGFVFFDTARTDSDPGALSVIAAGPRAILRGHIERDWDALRTALAAAAIRDGRDDGLPHGFAAGRIDYDGAFCFGLYDETLIFRHGEQSWHATGDLASRLASSAPRTSCVLPAFRPRLEPRAFHEMVRRAQEYIASGDIYQVNLSHSFESPWSGDPWVFYEALRHYSPAPYAAFLDLDGTTVLSSSPECFLRMSGRAIRTRPIKGTRPRRPDALADERSAFDLITSAKEISELVMITDLERNDLGQVCEFGSVTVPELLKLERHEQVFHLVSTVEGRLRDGADHPEALRACFPGGSITGAPKKRAREIIAELEPEPRGLYTGALGWFGFNGESQFAIAIRTVVIGGDRAQFHVGAGIVADSSPGAEWQETLDKAAGILLAAGRL